MSKGFHDQPPHVTFAAVLAYWSDGRDAADITLWGRSCRYAMAPRSSMRRRLGCMRGTQEIPLAAKGHLATDIICQLVAQAFSDAFS
jgi:hypothetical protein